MLSLNRDHEVPAAVRIAERMCVAARTAPKARGVDNIATGIITEGPERKKLAAEMRRYGSLVGADFFARDAENLEQSDACVIIGTRLQRLGIPGCDLCGYNGCEEAEAHSSRCAYNVGDLGIAIGSAVGVAADCRADNRVMYTIGICAVRLRLLGEDVMIAHGIPLAVKGKNIFFDRK